MATETVSGRTCEGCVAAVKRAVEKAVPGARATVSLARGEVEIEGAADLAPARTAIAAAGFGVVD